MRANAGMSADAWERHEKTPIRTVVVARCGVRAAEALITPALFSQLPPVRREKRENGNPWAI